MKKIKISGARQNNLKNLSLEIPKNKITVFTGVSGSGKSSLAFETIGAEAQRQINETQNSFVRNRLAHFGVPDVDKIEHLNVPVIINQKRLGGNVRSTVGTATDIYASLRLLFSRMGKPFVGYSNVFSFNNPLGMCPECQGLGFKQTINIDQLINKNKSLNEGAILFPTFQPGGFRWIRYANSGYFDNDRKLSDYNDEEWRLLLFAEEHRPPKPHKTWGKTMLYKGVIRRLEDDILKKESKEATTRHSAIRKILTTNPCPSCNGARLNKKILSCKINRKNIADCSALSIDDLLTFLHSIPRGIYEIIIIELIKKLENLENVGLQYLTLDRTTNTLSGGESQRIKMVKHLGNSLEDLIYIFDEPSIGLHPKDLENISNIIQQIKDKGNTVLIVEHDPDLIKIADHVVDMGPMSGSKGGEIVFEGSFKDLKKSTGKTGAYFSQKKSYNTRPRSFADSFIIKNAHLHNLKNISVKIPMNVLTVVSGVAGSGKSTLISKILPQQISNAKIVDQSMFVATARASLLTYLDISDDIRNLFARANGKKQQLFSRNGQGSCPNCKGLGIEKIDLAFMDEVEQLCEVCKGSGYDTSILKYKYNNKNIAEVMNLTVSEAITFFDDQPFVQQFRVMVDLGLDYLGLGQRLNTFSGGERQRLKLTKEINNKNHLLILDEPSTGLHPADTQKLMRMLNKMVDRGNTLVIIEHNMDIISQADWIIEIGPGAGKFGGQLIFEGTVKQLLHHKFSDTAKHLRRHLDIASTKIAAG